MKNRNFYKQGNASLRSLRRLRRYLVRPLRLTLEGREHVFRDPRELDFCLAPRTAVPALRISELYLRAQHELDAEADALAAMEGRLAGMLDADRDGRCALTGALGSAGVRVISKDHGWRDLFDQLLIGKAARHWLRIAVARYLGYLAQRRDVIGSISLLKAHAAAAPTAPLAPELATRVFAEPPGETAAPDGELQRLPQGRAVTLRLAQGREIPIRLARYGFSLSHERDWILVADDGRRYVLREGLNSVGRSRDNDVRVEGACRNVSRRHLLAQPLGADAIELTDVSTCGTFVTPTALAS